MHDEYIQSHFLLAFRIKDLFVLYDWNARTEDVPMTQICKLIQWDFCSSWGLCAREKASQGWRNFRFDREHQCAWLLHKLRKTWQLLELKCRKKRMGTEETLIRQSETKMNKIYNFLKSTRFGSLKFDQNEKLFKSSPWKHKSSSCFHESL